MHPEFLNQKSTSQVQAEVVAREEARKKEERARLAEAKAQCLPDKEPFSITTFQQLYALTNDQGDSIITPSLVEELEIQYYLKHGNLKSLKEFAALREELDAHNVG